MTHSDVHARVKQTSEQGSIRGDAVNENLYLDITSTYASMRFERFDLHESLSVTSSPIQSSEQPFRAILQYYIDSLRCGTSAPDLIPL